MWLSFVLYTRFEAHIWLANTLRRFMNLIHDSNHAKITISCHIKIWIKNHFLNKVEMSSKKSNEPLKESKHTEMDMDKYTHKKVLQEIILFLVFLLWADWEYRIRLLCRWKTENFNFMPIKNRESNFVFKSAYCLSNKIPGIHIELNNNERIKWFVCLYKLNKKPPQQTDNKPNSQNKAA